MSRVELFKELNQHRHNLKFNTLGAGEMAEQLRVLDALPEGRGSVPSTDTALPSL